MGSGDLMTVRSRIAPTPSGFLHLGNAVNFLLTWVLVRRAGGRLKLRIDDADCARSQPAFVEDIFRQLEWLGLDWDEGPAGPADFFGSHSQLLRRDRYQELLNELREQAELFPCCCSRKEIRAASPSGLYPGTCRGNGRPGGGHAIRVHVPEGSLVPVNGSVVPLCREMGDFVLWRRDDLPAYQLASLADDLADGITLIVRGEDLRVSTAAQLFLAGLLGRRDFLTATFYHHSLLTGPNGVKLSKSDNALSLAAMRRQGAQPSDVYRAAAETFGLGAEQVRNLAELLDLVCASARATDQDAAGQAAGCERSFC